MTDVLTLQEAAALLRCSADTVRRRALAGDLPGRSGLGGWRFNRTALLEWLARGDGNGGQKWHSISAGKRKSGGSSLPAPAASEYTNLLRLPTSGRRKNGTTR